MAGSFTETHQEHRTIRKLSIAWVADGSGDVNGTATTADIAGQIVKVTFEPGTGDEQPDVNYDVVLNDEEGVDLLQGAGSNRSNSTAESLVPQDGDGTAADSMLVAVVGKVTPVVSNAGASNEGTIHIFYR